MVKVYAIILAAGNGERLGGSIPKQFLKISGKTIIEHTIDAFEKHEQIDNIIIVINPIYKTLIEEILEKNNYSKKIDVLNGGTSRKESSYRAIFNIDDNDKVLIHDAVRPFVSEKIIYSCIAALDIYDAVDVAIETADTIIEVDEKKIIKEIPDRQKLLRGQTPQGFKAGIIKKAHEMAINDNFVNVTDDCGLVKKYNLSDVYVVEGEERNIKITYKEDLYLADKLFQLSSFNLKDKISINEISSKVIVVFGGTKGIGSEIVKIAEMNGSKVYAFSRANGLDITHYFEVSNELERIYSIEGRIDYVINTAGVLNLGKVEERNIEEIMSEINTNYIAAINIIKASIGYLKESKGGILLFTSSSYTRGRALYSIYSSTKAAIVNLVQGMHEELTQEGIRINAINPERTNTPMRRKNFGNEPKDTLLNPKTVAEISLQTILSNVSGQIVDVKKNS